MCKLVLLFGLCAAIQAYADDWKPVVHTGDGQYLVNMTSAKRRGNLVSFSDKMIYASNPALKLPRKYAQLETLEIGNCTHQTLASEYLVGYGHNGQLLDFAKVFPVARTVPKHSHAAAILSYVCSHVSSAIEAKNQSASTNIKAPSRTMTLEKLKRNYGAIIDVAARQNNLDKALIESVIAAESGFNAKAVSPKGAIGLMQVMPATASRFGVSNIFDPAQNIEAGARYLRYLKDLFKNNLPLVIAAYNAGEGAVVKYGNRIPPFQETQQYVPKVMAFYRKLQN